MTDERERLAERIVDRWAEEALVAPEARAGALELAKIALDFAALAPSGRDAACTCPNAVGSGPGGRTVGGGTYDPECPQHGGPFGRDAAAESGEPRSWRSRICGSGVGGGEVCWLPPGHEGDHNPDAPDPLDAPASGSAVPGEVTKADLRDALNACQRRQMEVLHQRDAEKARADRWERAVAAQTNLLREVQDALDAPFPLPGPEWSVVERAKYVMRERDAEKARADTAEQRAKAERDERLHMEQVVDEETARADAAEATVAQLQARVEDWITEEYGCRADQPRHAYYIGDLPSPCPGCRLRAALADPQPGEQSPCGPVHATWFEIGVWPTCACGFDPKNITLLTEHWRKAGFEVVDEHGTLVRRPA